MYFQRKSRLATDLNNLEIKELLYVLNPWKIFYYVHAIDCTASLCIQYTSVPNRNFTSRLEKYNVAAEANFLQPQEKVMVFLKKRCNDKQPVRKKINIYIRL